MKSAASCVLGICLAGLWLTPASAATLSTGVQTFDESFESPLNFGQTFTGTGVLLKFPFFDASLGALTEVHIRIDATFDSELTLSGRGQSPELEPIISVNGGLDFFISLKDPAFSNGSVFNTSANDGPSCNLPFEAQCNASSPLKAAVNDIFVYSLSEALEFAGTGLFDLAIDGFSAVNVDVSGEGGATYSAGHAGRLFGETEVIYFYDAIAPVGVPEPASLAILGLGLIGLAGARCARTTRGV